MKNATSTTTARLLILGFTVFSVFICLSANLSAQTEEPPQLYTPRTFPIPDEVPRFEPPAATYWDYLPRIITDLFTVRGGGQISRRIGIRHQPAQELSIALDGQTGYLKVPDSPSLGLTTGAYTIEAWIKPRETDTRKGILEKYQTGVGGFDLSITPKGGIRFAVLKTESDLAKSSISGTIPVALDSWSHVAVVVNGKNVSIYLNGVMDVQAELALPAATNVADLTIGLSHDIRQNPEFFNGELDEIRWSNYAVYGADFAPERVLHGGGVFGLTAGSWRFTDGRLDDGSGNANTASIAGNAVFIGEAPESMRGSANVSPASTINFDTGLPTNSIIGNHYPDVSFFQFNNVPLYAEYWCTDYGMCPGQSYPNFATDQGNGQQPAAFTFRSPTNVAGFDVLASDTPGGWVMGRYGILQDGTYYSGYLISNGRNSDGYGYAVRLNISQLRCGGSNIFCDHASQVSIYNIIDPYGIGYDNFSYTEIAAPTPTPPPCISGGSNGAVMPPCQPTPTPTPDLTPTAPTGVMTEEKPGEVRIKWNWAPSQERPTYTTGWKIYRSDTSAGPFVYIGQALDHGELFFNDVDKNLQIGQIKYYRVKSFHTQYGESEASNTASGGPLSGCEAGQFPTPPALVSFSRHGWTGTFDTTYWLDARDVQLNGRQLARRMGNEIEVHYFVDNEWTNLPLESPVLVGYEPPNFNDGEKIAISKTHCLSTKNGQHRWTVKFQFIFKRRDGKNCEPGGVIPCARFYPVVSYEYYSKARFERLPEWRVRLVQRLHFRENDDPTQLVQLFADCGPAPCGLNFPIFRNFPVQRESEVKFLSSGVQIIWGARMFDHIPPPEGDAWDNLHQTGDPAIAPPNASVFRVAGCMSCVHDHWRWPSVEPNRCKPQPAIWVPLGTCSEIDVLDFRPGQNLIGDDQFKRNRTVFRLPRQTANLTFTKFSAGEENHRTPWASSSNHESLYQAQKINGALLQPRGGDLVTWYMGYSQQTPIQREDAVTATDTFHAHGGFFAELAQPEGRFVEKALGPPPNPTFFSPIKIVSENLYQNGSVGSEFLNPISGSTLPPLYSYVSAPDSSKPVKVTYSSFSPVFFASGKQSITFQVTNSTIPMNNLRVLFRAWDEVAMRWGWVDVTYELSTTNRTITGRFEFTSPGGPLDASNHLFLLAQHFPSAQPAMAGDLALSGAASPEPIRSGNNLTYTWTVTNTGPDASSGVAFMQVLDPKVTFVSATSTLGQCVEPLSIHEGEEEGRVRCNIGTLQNGASATITVVARVLDFGDATDPNGLNESIDTTGLLTAESEDPNSTNDSVVLSSTALPSVNKPPTVQISSPATGATFVSPSAAPTTISFSIIAGDADGTIAQVDLVDNGKIIGQGIQTTGTNYSFNKSNPEYGEHTAIAIATDNGGRKTYSAPVSFLVNSASTIVIESPLSSSLISPGSSLTVQTRSNVPGARIQKIQLFSNGILLGTLRSSSNVGGVFTHKYIWDSVPKGSYRLHAVLTEISGATTTSVPVLLTANTAATVNITSPSDGQSFASGASITVASSIEDSDGQVERIEYFANGSLLGTDLDAIASGTRSFNWRGPEDGVYSIVTVVTDDAGTTTTSNPVNIGINRPAPAIGEMTWVDDRLPTGATSGGDDGWNWTNLNPNSLMGNLTNQSLLKSGLHEHFFENASFKLQVNTDEKLSAWIFLDPDFPPAEIMLQWKDEQGWEHRAYWGDNLINLGTDGTNSRRSMGSIPTGSGWKQLKVPANLVGLEGKLVNGMKFTLHGGRANWDRIGKLLATAPEPGPPQPDFVWNDDAPPSGSILEAIHDSWNVVWISVNPTPYNGTRAHKHWDSDNNEIYRQHSFRNATSTMSVNPGDTLFTWAYIHNNAEYIPDSIVLQWHDSAGWYHRAYWGRDLRYNAPASGLAGAVTNSEGWRYMGPLPTPGVWTRLEIPASYVGLEGKRVDGMAFGVYKTNGKGRVVWDYSGKTSTPPVSPSAIPPLKFTTPLWRFACGTGNSMRLRYSLNVDHYYFNPSANCSAAVNIGYTYPYQAPGTIPLYVWEHFADPRRWRLETCTDCEVIHNYTRLFPVAYVALPQMPFSVRHTRYSCNSEDYYTTYPNPPGPPNPGVCSGPLYIPEYYVHER